MSEKRFTVKSIKNNHYQIAENDLKMLSYEVVDFLNTSSDAISSLQYENVKLKKKVDEQQATINKLKSDIEETEISIKLFEDDVNMLSEENEQLRQKLDNFQELCATLGAELLMNGFEIEIDGKDLSELIKDE